MQHSRLESTRQKCLIAESAESEGADRRPQHRQNLTRQDLKRSIKRSESYAHTSGRIAHGQI